MAGGEAVERPSTLRACSGEGPNHHPHHPPGAPGRAAGRDDLDDARRNNCCDGQHAARRKHTAGSMDGAIGVATTMKPVKPVKTNAARLLDSLGIAYEVQT